MERISRLALGATFCVLVVLTIACSRSAPPDSRAVDEAAIRDTDDAWLEAIAAKEVGAIASFYDENASLFAPNAPIVTGREAIRSTLSQLFSSPGFVFTPRTTKVEVARSGDLAYAQGVYDLTIHNPKGVPTADRGKFVVVWKKQADGSWKAVADIFNSDLPATPSSR